MLAQFNKGIAELCVFALLVKRKFYGYELVRKISKGVSVSEGTIYPLLKRLKTEEMVLTHLRDGEGSGPARKYYSLTTKGQAHAKSLISEWYQFAKEVSNLINNKEVEHE